MNYRNALLGLGFQVTRKVDKLEYTKVYYCDDLAFKIELDPLMIQKGKLPRARVIEVPDCFLGQALPHISDEELCYVDSETITWNPLELEETCSTVDMLIQRTINLISTRNWIGEYDGELLNYWKGSSDVFLMADIKGHSIAASNNLYCQEVALQLSTEDTDTEFIVHDSDSSIEDWCRVRGASKKGSKLPVVTVSMRPDVAIGLSWPPSDLKSLLSWLKKTDHNAHNVLVNRIGQRLKETKKSKLVCLVYTGDNCYLGVRIEFASMATKFFENLRGGISSNVLAERLSGRKWQKTMERLAVQVASPEFIIKRNLGEEGLALSGLKIALIGAGTIGSFAAKMLVDVGAGSNRGALTVFDSDCLSTSNLGRHLLPATYVCWPKSSALKHYLESVSIVKIKVDAALSWDIQKNDIADYDLVIDVTGSEPFSILLSNNFHNSQKALKRTKLIHAWVDGGGRCVRGLLDIGHAESACYGCLDKDAHPVLSTQLADSFVFSRQCGSTYTPYPSGVSQAAASTVQALSIEAIKSKPEITFYQHATSKHVINKKPSRLKASSLCRVNNHG